MKYFALGRLVLPILLTSACTQWSMPVEEHDEAGPAAPQVRHDNSTKPLADQAVGRHKMLSAEVSQGSASYRIAAMPAPVSDREQYDRIDSHGVVQVSRQPVSTFSIDVDTASYANVRRMLQAGRLPSSDAVRVEELINYFPYSDEAPASRDEVFHVSSEMVPTPWNAKTHLLRLGLSAWEGAPADLPASNLVFLIDVSGSMNSHDKLPLLKRSLSLLTRKMRKQDKVSLVVYAGAAGVVLEPTEGHRHATIDAALNALSAGGSTHGSAGIHLAYAKAREAFIKGGINRVILATDGDFNVGTVDHQALLDLIERERKSGISLTTLGFGRGNLNDHLMEQLADHGNGNYAYIDTLMEAQKVLVEERGGTLHTLARDVKVQIEFNPARVAEYRLIGYENRALKTEDFHNDRVDAGELGAGHRIVALYELSLAGESGNRIDPLRYAQGKGPLAPSHDAELGYLKLRYKPEGTSESVLRTQALTDDIRSRTLAASSNDIRFSSAVAAFAQLLRGGRYLQDFAYPDILALARGARGDDPQGYRSEFLRVVSLAEALDARVNEVAQSKADERDG